MIKKIVVLALSSAILHAGIFDFQTIDEAKKAFAKGNYALSSKLFGEVGSSDKRKFYNQANAYYKAGEYDKAIESYAKAKGMNEEFNRLYNIGNSYFKKNDMPLAIKHYEDALKINPNDKDAQKNLALAKRKPPQPPKQEPKDSDKKDENKKEPPKEDKSKDKKEPNEQQQSPQEKMNAQQLQKLLKELEKKKMPTPMYQYNNHGDKKGESNENSAKPW